MLKQMQFNPYKKEVLLEGFSYPESYLKLADDTSSIVYDDEYSFPWWFENAEENINDDLYIYMKS